MSRRHYRLYKRIDRRISSSIATEGIFTYDGIARLESNDFRMLKDAICLWVLTSSDLVGIYCDSETQVNDFVTGFLADVYSLCVLKSQRNVARMQTVLKETLESFRSDRLSLSLLRQSISEWGFGEPGDGVFVHTCKWVNEHVLGNEEWYMVLHHILTFLSKMPCDPLDDSLSERAVSDFIEIDRCLPNAEEFDVAIIRKLRLICEGWFALWKGTGYRKFGSGSTADAGRHPGKKVQALGYYPGMEHLIGQNLDLETIYWLERKSMVDTIEIVSKLQTVPKNALKKRTICMEPATMTYLQEGVFRSFVRIFEQSEMRFHVFLDNQDKMREKCLAASKDGSYATLDLSAASDSTLKELPLLILPARVATEILATRTPQCLLPDGTIFPLRKFCSMGSKVCFPLEITIFAAVIEMVCRDHGLPVDERQSAYYVYGDDLIVRSDLVPDVESVLEHLGYRINKEKSFSRTRSDEDQMCFRESCGIFCLNGVDITTPALSRFFTAITTKWETPETAAMKIGLANRLLLAGMFSARLFVINSLRNNKGELQWPFVEFRPEFLQQDSNDFDKTYWSQHGLWYIGEPDNYHLKRRKSPKATRFPDKP